MSRRVHPLLALGPRVVALLVLIASLLAAPIRVVAETAEPCCCPRPEECPCHDHGSPAGSSSFRPCDRPTDHDAPVSAAPAALPAPIVVIAPAATLPAPAITLPSPHASPDLERPRGPS